MFYLVASTATLTSYHTLSYLVNNFFNFFSKLFVVMQLTVCVLPAVLAASLTRIPFPSINVNNFFKLFLQIIHILFTRCKNPSLAFHFHDIYNKNTSILFRYYS